MCKGHEGTNRFFETDSRRDQSSRDADINRNIARGVYSRGNTWRVCGGAFTNYVFAYSYTHTDNCSECPNSRPQEYEVSPARQETYVERVAEKEDYVVTPAHTTSVQAAPARVETVQLSPGRRVVSSLLPLDALLVQMRDTAQQYMAI